MYCIYTFSLIMVLYDISFVLMLSITQKILWVVVEQITLNLNLKSIWILTSNWPNNLFINSVADEGSDWPDPNPDPNPTLEKKWIQYETYRISGALQVQVAQTFWNMKQDELSSFALLAQLKSGFGPGSSSNDDRNSDPGKNMDPESQHCSLRNHMSCSEPGPTSGDDEHPDQDFNQNKDPDLRSDPIRSLSLWDSVLVLGWWKDSESGHQQGSGSASLLSEPLCAPR